MNPTEILAKLTGAGVKLWIENDRLYYRAPKESWNSELHAALVEHKTAILELLRQREQENSTTKLPKIIPDPLNRYQPFPLNDLQQAYWLGRNGEFDLGNVSSYYYVEMEGVNVDLERLTKAFNCLIARHDSLRTKILPNGQQQIQPSLPYYEIPVNDLRGKSSAQVETRLIELRSQLSQQVLPLDLCPLIDLRACLLDENKTRIHLGFDNLILDALSSQLFLQEWFYLYNHPDSQFVPLEISFRDYLLKELQLRKSDLYQQSKDYWFEKLATLPPAPELPLVTNLAAVGKPRFLRRQASLSRQTWQKLKSKAAKVGLTPSGLICAAFSEILAFWSKKKQFSLVLTVFDRLSLHPQVNEILGDFTKTILLAVDNGEKTFLERAKALQHKLWESLEHSHVNGVEILRELSRQKGLVADAAMPIVFTSNLVTNGANDLLRNGHILDELPLEEIYGISQTPQVLLDYQVSEKRGMLIFNWDSVDRVFPEGMLDQMFESHCRHLERLAHEEEAWLETTPPLMPVVQLAQRIAINGTDIPLTENLLHSLFWQQVQRNPQQLAVIAPNLQLTYAQLGDRVFHLTAQLQQLGATPNRLIAVIMEKGWEQVIATLAILTAGAAYVPIDPQLPPARIEHLLAQSQVEIVLTQSHLIENLTLEKLTAIAVNCNYDYTDNSDRYLRWLTNFTPLQKPEDLAYVIYTSGSTGTPKGVAIDHRGAVNTILDLNRRFEVSQGDRVLALSSLSFDLSVYDIFGTLAAGGSIIIPQAEVAKDPAHWAELIQQHQVTVWNSVPALMQLYCDYLPSSSLSASSLRLVLLSGDWIAPTLPVQIKTIASQSQIVSLGGATEASIWSIYYPIDTTDTQVQTIPYGYPLSNQRWYVLDENLQSRPVWVTGQLYIGGIGLAQGYWGDPEKTNASFIIHPDTGERIYRTGDLGRYLPNGAIEFLGREDAQVKVQGYRIELGEIETVLATYTGVRQAAAIAIGSKARRLIAYLVIDSDSFNKEDLKYFLAQKLPEYMIPHQLIELKEMPLTVNGKIDRSALTNLTKNRDSTSESTTSYFAPKNEIEQILVKVWQQTLSLAKIGTNDNFFAIGGNSLAAIKIITELQDIFQIKIPLRVLTTSPNIQALATTIETMLLKDIDSEIEKMTEAEAQKILQNSR
ncbi:MAG: amino acid adenylation domain-containing protein [Pleurocapsa sp.]